MTISTLSVKYILLIAVFFLWSSNIPSFAYKFEDVERLRTTRICIAGDLRNADLSSFDLRGAQLKSANLQGAILPDLRETDIYNANLTDSTITNQMELQQLKPLYLTSGQCSSFNNQGQREDLRAVSINQLNSFRFLQISDLNKVSKGPQYFKAAYYYDTYGNSQQEATALEYYKEAAHEDIVEAYNNLGWMYENGRGTPVNLAQARIYYQQAQDANVPYGSYNLSRWKAMYDHNEHAQVNLGHIYSSRQKSRELGIECDFNQAAYWYKQAAQQDNSCGQFELGVLYKNGLGIRRDYEQARNLFTQAANKGHLDAQVNLAKMLEQGLGGKVDISQALYYYQLAAEHDNLSAQITLGSWHENGHTGIVQNYQSAYNWYLRAARQGDPQAQYHASRLFAHLPFDPLNIIIASSQTESAANSNHAGAQFLLATYLEKGIGHFRNINRAYQLYEAAAEQGFVPAQLQVAFIKRLYNKEIQTVDTPIIMTCLRTLSEEAERRLQIELSQCYVIRNAYYYHNLNADYRNIERVIAQLRHDTTELGLQLNYEQISADPYLGCNSPSNLISDDQVTELAIRQLFEVFEQAVRTHPAYAYVRSHRLTTDFILEKLLQNTNNLRVRKQFLQLLYMWTNDITGLSIPEDQSNTLEARLRYRQGESLIRLARNMQYYQDDLSRYLQETEWQMYFNTAQSLPLGMRLSLVFTNYKVNFIYQHCNPLPNASKEANETVELLYQRMRLPLGLPGNFQNFFLSSMEKRDDDKYIPFKVMQRFLRGGSIEFLESDQQGAGCAKQSFEAYTPTLMIRLLRQSLEDSCSIVLQPMHLNDFIINDPILKDAYEQACINMLSNKYFDARGRSSQKSDFYQDHLLIYVLKIHGYIVG